MEAKAFSVPGFSVLQVWNQQLNKESVITFLFPHLGSSSGPIKHLPNFCFWPFQVWQLGKEREEEKKKKKEEEESSWHSKYSLHCPALFDTDLFFHEYYAIDRSGDPIHSAKGISLLLFIKQGSSSYFVCYFFHYFLYPGDTFIFFLLRFYASLWYPLWQALTNITFLLYEWLTSTPWEVFIIPVGRIFLSLCPPTPT